MPFGTKSQNGLKDLFQAPSNNHGPPEPIRQLPHRQPIMTANNTSSKATFLYCRDIDRTKRMIKEAERLTFLGVSVHIVFASDQDIKQIRRLFPPATFCGFMYHSAEDPGFDWELLRMRDAERDHVFFVAPNAIEKRYERQLKMLHMWDRTELPPPANP